MLNYINPYKVIENDFNKIKMICEEKKITLTIITSIDDTPVRSDKEKRKSLYFSLYCAEGNLRKLEKLSKLKFSKTNVEKYVFYGLLNAIKNQKWNACHFLVEKCEIEKLPKDFPLTLGEIIEYEENMKKIDLYKSLNQNLPIYSEERMKVKI